MPERRPSGDSGLIPPHGGYRKLRSFWCAQIVYDATQVFCRRFVNKLPRMCDQMVQAARSGVQNIAEGSEASATSKKAELKLTNVAKSSLEELLLDYMDFLRQHGWRLWHKDSPEALVVRRKYLSLRSDASDRSDQSDRSDRSDRSDQSDRSDRSDQSDMSDGLCPSELCDPYGIAAASPEVAANTLVCLINQATFLLARQLQYLERAFLAKGGFTERLYRCRQARRSSCVALPRSADPTHSSESPANSAFARPGPGQSTSGTARRQLDGNRTERNGECGERGGGA